MFNTHNGWYIQPFSELVSSSQNYCQLSCDYPTKDSPTPQLLHLVQNVVQDFLQLHSLRVSTIQFLTEMEMHRAEVMDNPRTEYR